MKKVVVVIVCLAAVIGGVLFWNKTRGGEAKSAAGKPAADKPADEDAAGPTIEHDTNGRVVITISDELQGNNGITVSKLAAMQISPELKGYGHVLDPVPLAALMNELASAQAAYAASSNELARAKTLAGQGNASARALQTAEATALHDQLTIASAKDRLVLSLGKAVAGRNDLPAFIESLTSLEAVLVRIDLPAGEMFGSEPLGARVVSLSGDAGDAEFLGFASNVDPQTQGRGFLFLMKTNAARLLPGAAVTGYLKLPGEAVSGVVVPRAAVVRIEGAGWMYVLTSGDDVYTRLPLTLDHPVDAGWFVTNGVTATNYVIVTGAQTLLSEELKASLKPD